MLSIQHRRSLRAGAFLALLFVGGVFLFNFNPSLPQIIMKALSLSVLRDLCIAWLTIALLSIGVTLGVALHIVKTITHPRRNEHFIPITPFALGLPAEEVSFPCKEGLHEVLGLYIPHPQARSTILICPGYRRSYTDVLEVCKHVYDAGHTVLAFEFYGHSTPTKSLLTLGYREVDDFMGAVTYAKVRSPSTRLGAIGYSMGAAVTIMACARRAEVEALVVDSGFATQWSSVQLAVRRTLRLPMPDWTMQFLYLITDTLLYWHAGYHFAQVEPVREIHQISPRPILIIHGQEDTIVSPKDAFSLYEAAAEPKELWLIPKSEHIRGYFVEYERYTRKIITFFEQHLRNYQTSDTQSLVVTGTYSHATSSTGAFLNARFASRENFRGLGYEDIPPCPPDSLFADEVPLLPSEKEPDTMPLQTSVRTEPLLWKDSASLRKNKAKRIRLRRLRRMLKLRYSPVPTNTPSTTPSRSLALGKWLYRLRWPLVALWIVALAVSIPFASSLTPLLHNSGYLAPGSASDQANRIVTNTLHQPVSQVLVLFQSDTTPVSSPAYQKEVHSFLSLVKTFPHVTNARVGGTGRNGKTTVVIVGFNADQDEVATHLSQFHALLPTGQGNPARAMVTGEPAITNEIQLDTQTDSQHAELLAMPLTFIALLVVFGSLVAGLMPLALAGVVVPVTLAIISVIAVHVQTNIFVMDVASLIGLGLSIDYSLFIIRRFREELENDRTVSEAIAWTMATAGEAVLFSGLTVMIGFSGLFLIGIPIMTSFGLGGVVTAATAAAAALTLLPALLSILGTRINTFHLPHLRRATRRGGETPGTRQQSFWHSWASVVMRHPLLMILLVTVALIGLGLPAFSLNPGLPGVSALPPQSEARQTLERLNAQFPDLDTDPIFVVVQWPNNSTMVQPQNLRNLQLLDQRIATIGHVSGISSLMTPPDQGGKIPNQQQLLLLYSTGQYQRIPALAQLVSTTTQGNTTLISVRTETSAKSSERQVVIDHLRAISQQQDHGLRIFVGGPQAVNLDFDRVLYGNFLRSLIFILGATYVLLLLMFRSVILPLKAIVMNILSISAAYGALVVIFQQGHLQNVLKFTSDGSLDRFIPVLLFCVLFGLSMDYEVFLLSRMKEEWHRTGDNRLAVIHGLEQTGSIITSAAFLFIIVAASFVTTSLIVTKELGAGIVIALIVDASIIRTILVPAAMQLMGRVNWWFPGQHKTAQAEEGGRRIVLQHRGKRVFIHPISATLLGRNIASMTKRTRQEAKKTVREHARISDLSPTSFSAHAEIADWPIPLAGADSESIVYPSYVDRVFPPTFFPNTFANGSGHHNTPDDHLLIRARESPIALNSSRATLDNGASSRVNNEAQKTSEENDHGTKKRMNLDGNGALLENQV